MDRLAIIAALILRDGEVCHLCGQGRVPSEPWEAPASRARRDHALVGIHGAHVVVKI